jgi:hypothetical protein
MFFIEKMERLFFFSSRAFHVDLIRSNSSQVRRFKSGDSGESGSGDSGESGNCDDSDDSDGSGDTKAVPMRQVRIKPAKSTFED